MQCPVWRALLQGPRAAGDAMANGVSNLGHRMAQCIPSKCSEGPEGKARDRLSACA